MACPDHAATEWALGARGWWWEDVDDRVKRVAMVRMVFMGGDIHFSFVFLKNDS